MAGTRHVIMAKKNASSIHFMESIDGLWRKIGNQLWSGWQDAQLVTKTTNKMQNAKFNGLTPHEQWYKHFLHKYKRQFSGFYHDATKKSQK